MLQPIGSAKRTRSHMGFAANSSSLRVLVICSTFFVFGFSLLWISGSLIPLVAQVDHVAAGPGQYGDATSDWHDTGVSSTTDPTTLSQTPGTDNNRIISKAIISSTWGETRQNAWISELLPDWTSVSYVIDDFKKNGNSSLRSRRGRESSVYLTYMIDHYDNLPDYMVFVHGTRWQFHNDEPMYDTLPLIANLSLDYVERQQYTSLRCEKTLGCAHWEMHPFDESPEGTFPWGKFYQEAHAVFFPGEEVPELVKAPCCSQFAVTRAAVRATPLALWQQRRDFLWNKEVVAKEPLVWLMGSIMELLWHSCFGKPPRHCGWDVQSCYCEMWGVCGLECKELECKGRYWGNPLFFNESKGGPHKLPENWPDREAQGTMGMPFDRWWEHLDANWTYHPPNGTNMGDPPTQLGEPKEVQS